MYTHSAPSEYIVDRFAGATASESYDCYADDPRSGIKFLVNIKAENGSSANNAVDAIGQLHRNYCESEPEQQKSYIILKVKYAIRDAYEETDQRRAKPRHLYIEGLESFCIEEIDFRQDHKQDNRSWSISPRGGSQRNNGRLVISKRFREDHRMPEDEISYFATWQMLDELYQNNH